jgi:hypothetical protein
MSEPYRIRSSETWEAARLAYLDGCSAEEVCGRFDLGLSSLRKRARAEGWRRADQADPEPVEDDDLPDMDDQALADLAHRRMGVAARRGAVVQALRWARLREFALRQIAARQGLEVRRAAPGPARPDVDTHEVPEAPPQPPETPRERAFAILARARAELHEIHQFHSNSGVEVALNRTERRRLKALKKQTGPPG